MDFQKFLSDKSIKPKEKTEKLSQWLLDNPNEIEVLIEFAKSSKDPVKATCIEAMEFATNFNPYIAPLACLEFVTNSLTETAPRVKWESAKVIGNIAHIFPNQLEEATKNLILNTEHSGTVVRWSAAFALGDIIKLNTNLNKELIPFFNSICLKEEKNSIKKIYLAALKKVNNTK